MDTNETSPVVGAIRTHSVINRSSVKAYALKVSAERRAGKFTRVGEDFLNAVEADVEAAIRQIATKPGDESWNDQLEGAVAPGDDREFITGAAIDKLRERLNERTRAIVSGRVRRHPSIGCTLKD